MPLNFRCPHCANELAAPDGAEGGSGTCRFCGAAILAPNGPDQPATLISPPQAPPVFGGVESRPAGPIPPTGDIRLSDIFDETWAILKANLTTFIAASAIILGLGQVMQSVAWAFLMPFWMKTIVSMQNVPKHGPPPALPAGSYMAFGLFFAVLMVLQIALLPLHYGPYYLVDQLLTRGRADIGTMFKAYRHFWSFLGMAFFMVLIALAAEVLLFLLVAGLGALTNKWFHNVAPFVVVMIVCWLLLVVLMSQFLLAPVEIVDRGAHALDAMKASWKMCAGRRWRVAGISFILMLASIAGVFACGIGMLFTMPFQWIGLTLLYRNLRGLNGTPY